MLLLFLFLLLLLLLSLCIALGWCETFARAFKNDSVRRSLACCRVRCRCRRRHCCYSASSSGLGSCALASCLSTLSAAFALSLIHTHTHTHMQRAELLVTFVFVFPLCAGFSHALAAVLFMYPTVAECSRPSQVPRQQLHCLSHTSAESCCYPICTRTAPSPSPLLSLSATQIGELE